MSLNTIQINPLCFAIAMNRASIYIFATVKFSLCFKAVGNDMHLLDIILMKEWTVVDKLGRRLLHQPDYLLIVRYIFIHLATIFFYNVTNDRVAYNALNASRLQYCHRDRENLLKPELHTKNIWLSM